MSETFTLTDTVRFQTTVTRPHIPDGTHPSQGEDPFRWDVSGCLRPNRAGGRNNRNLVPTNGLGSGGSDRTTANR